MINKILILTAAATFTAHANTGSVRVPQPIQPPPGSVLQLQAAAEGVQIYQCVLDNGQFHWQLTGPEAILSDTQDQVLGRHFAGPVWEHRDGSRVTGVVLRKFDAAAGKAIPWLLLKAEPAQGAGQFAGIRFINRVDTEGGLAPKTLCDGNHLGSEKRIPYRARYYFYR